MGNIQILHDFYSPGEGFNRTIRIFTPEGYDANPNQRFPVLYMFDGQNIFAHPESAVYDTWCANWTMDKLAQAGTIPPWIIVGIDHTGDRFNEYSPWIGGHADRTAKFLVETLKPYIDSHYRTRPEHPWTGVMGSSMGGLITLYIGRTYPQVFGRIGSLSAALMWGKGLFDKGQMFSLWDRKTDYWSKIYIYVGGAEQYSFSGVWLDYPPINRDFYEHLKDLGYNDHEVHFKLAEGEPHHEKAWQRQLPDIMTWLLEDAQGV
jgi:predicted alpha/beta superfamily hydrolase